MTATAKAISVKDTAFGQDMLEVLAERQLEKVSFRELDISHSILNPKGASCQKTQPRKLES